MNRTSLLALGLPLVVSCANTGPVRVEPSGVYTASGAYDSAPPRSGSYDSAPAAPAAPATLGAYHSAPAPTSAYASAPPTQLSDDDIYGRNSRQPSNTRIQGLIGWTDATDVNVDLDPSFGSIEETDSASLPMVGGVLQHPLGGNDRISAGLEGGFTLGWDTNRSYISVGGGGLLIVSDNDLLLVDLFAGPYVEALLGDRWRWYAGIGPMLQYANIDIDYDDPSAGNVSIRESGFGGGVYARTGLEIAIRPGYYLGFGVRYIDASVDPGGPINDLEFEGVQYALTATTGF